VNTTKAYAAIDACRSASDAEFVRSRLALLGLIALAIVAPSAEALSGPRYGSVGELRLALARHGVRCDGFQRVARTEGRCRHFAFATFANAAQRHRWQSARQNEPWFPARFLVVGPTWAAWTWDEETGRSLRSALKGRLARFRPRQTLRPHVVFRRCDGGPARTDCPPLPPARPVPISPDGPVYSTPVELWESETMAWFGLYVVARTAPGTTALTGVVMDDRPTRPPFGPPIAEALVTLELASPSEGAVRLRTITDRQGSFAFVDAPVAPEGTCYRLTVAANSFGSFKTTELFERTTYEIDIPLEGGELEDVSPACLGR
jgi:hypothetical protein